MTYVLHFLYNRIEVIEMATTTPLRYPGGKSKTYSYVRELIRLNNCSSYIETYAGGAGVATSLLLNDDVEKIMLNDYDKGIYAFWYSVINNHEALIEMIQTTNITIDEWHKQKEIQQSKEQTNDLLDLGFSTLFLNRTNRSGIIKAGVIGGKSQTGHYKLDCRFNKEDICNRIIRIANERSRIKLYNQDAEEFIKRSVTHTRNSLTFLDPPYYEKGPGLYTNFYKHGDHQSLANTIQKHMQNKHWILTYDTSPNILAMYQDYANVEYYLNYSAGTPSTGIEYMFFSPDLQIGNINDYLRTK